MTWRIAWMSVGAAFFTGMAVTLLANGVDGPAGKIVITMLLLASMVLIVRLVPELDDGATTKHRHTFGTWETSWWKNENGTKAGVANQIRTCSECGLIEKRKP
jgi:hypothetical protein